MTKSERERLDRAEATVRAVRTTLERFKVRVRAMQENNESLAKSFPDAQGLRRSASWLKSISDMLLEMEAAMSDPPATVDDGGAK